MEFDIGFLADLPKKTIQEKKDSWSKAWSGEPLRKPLKIVNKFKKPVKPVVKNTKEFLQNDQLNLKQQLLEIKNRVIGEDDYVPAVTTYMGTTVFASAFGCKTIWPEDGQPWAEPLIDKPKEVAKLKIPDVKDGLLGKVIERTEWFMEVTEGKLPIRVTDIQGPLDTAYLIWHNEEFLTAIYDEPNAVHDLLNMVTELIINFVKVQKKIVDEFIPITFPYEIYTPSDDLIGISEDVVVTLSGDIYEEFILPYHQKLADEFNGLFVHSCGEWTRIIEKMKNINRLKGVDFGVTETGYTKIEKLLDGKALLSARVGLNFGPDRYETELEYVKDVVSKTRDGSNVCIYITGNVPNPVNPADPHDYRPIEGKNNLEQNLANYLNKI